MSLIGSGTPSNFTALFAAILHGKLAVFPGGMASGGCWIGHSTKPFRALLDEIIATRKTKAIAYEEYLKRIAELAKRVEAGQAEETPKALNTPGKRALYNNLNQNEDLALRIDETVRNMRPDGWRGVQAREQVIKAALYDVLRDVADVERIFLIIKAQSEY
jgi:type I restriction enzyme, R subunit